MELGERISRTWRAFFANREFLCCRRSPLGKRFELLTSLVSHSLFWCSGSWNLTRRQESRLRAVQHKMMMKMLGLRCLAGESKGEYMARVGRKLKHLRTVHGIRLWHKVYLKSVYSWAGHVARMGSYQESRLTHRILKFKKFQWIQSVAADNGGSQLHGRKLRTWRWERPLYKQFADRQWEEEAQDKQSWTSRLDKMVEWWCNFR